VARSVASKEVMLALVGLKATVHHRSVRLARVLSALRHHHRACMRCRRCRSGATLRAELDDGFDRVDVDTASRRSFRARAVSRSRSLAPPRVNL
jgi:hypothetical protein